MLCTLKADTYCHFGNYFRGMKKLTRRHSLWHQGRNGSFRSFSTPFAYVQVHFISSYEITLPLNFAKYDLYMGTNCRSWFSPHLFVLLG